MTVASAADQAQQDVGTRREDTGRIFVDMRLERDHVAVGQFDRKVRDVTDDEGAGDPAGDGIAAGRRSAGIHRLEIDRLGRHDDLAGRTDRDAAVAVAAHLAEPRFDDDPFGLDPLHRAVEDGVAADELRDERRLRPGVEPVRRRDLLDVALVHHHDAVRKRQRLGLRVGNENKGDAEISLQQLQFVLDGLAQIGVKRAQRLVEQQDVGLDDEAARKRDALPLAAGELSASLVGNVGRARASPGCGRPWRRARPWRGP